MSSCVSIRWHYIQVIFALNCKCDESESRLESIRATQTAEFARLQSEWQHRVELLESRLGLFPLPFFILSFFPLSQPLYTLHIFNFLQVHPFS